MEKIRNIKLSRQIFCSRTLDCWCILTADAGSTLVHDDECGKQFPLFASIIRFCDIAAAVISRAVFLTVADSFFRTFAYCRGNSCQIGKKYRRQTGVVQMVDGKFHQIIMAYISIIEMVETFTKPICKFRKFLQMTGMESGIRILCRIWQCVGKILIQIEPFLDPVSLFQLVL